MSNAIICIILAIAAICVLTNFNDGNQSGNLATGV